uniref:adenosine deaminase-like isoform X1 n=1 Tax=Styela clava TaxID=7725 RepID=UPI00193A8238|nr:adenosine deaminase-like isoform X1 [Styela clava]
MPPNESDRDVDHSNNYNFPKVELHCHLDGCYRFSTIAELAKKRGIYLQKDESELKKFITAQTRCNSLPHYLEKIYNATRTYAGDEDGIARITREAIEDKAADGVVYLELRYAPHLFANCDVEPMVHAEERGRLRPKDVMDIVNKTVKECENEYGIRVTTILCALTPFEWGEETAKLCQEYESHGVVGIDIAGPEGSEDFPLHCQRGFEFCRINGIHRTAHAGEVGPAGHVKKAIEQLHAERIGHGYRMLEDDACYGIVKQHRTHVEVCPMSSHFTTGAPEDWSKHPARRFHEDNINFSLSSDDPGVHLASLIGDYDIATTMWGFTTQDLFKLNLNAARSCFLNEVERKQLVSDLKREYANYNDIVVEYDSITSS